MLAKNLYLNGNTLLLFSRLYCSWLSYTGCPTLNSENEGQMDVKVLEVGYEA